MRDILARLTVALANRHKIIFKLAADGIAASGIYVEEGGIAANRSLTLRCC
jgi:hypothetical protein